MQIIENNNIPIIHILFFWCTKIPSFPHIVFTLLFQFFISPVYSLYVKKITFPLVLSAKNLLIHEWTFCLNEVRSRIMQEKNADLFVRKKKKTIPKILFLSCVCVFHLTGINLFFFLLLWFLFCSLERISISILIMLSES